jgi:hypothetical protein
MSEITTLFDTDSNKFTAVKTVVEIEGEIADGSVIPKSDTITDNEYKVTKLLHAPSGMPNQVVKDGYQKVFTKDITRVRKTDPTIEVEYYDALDKDTDNAGTNRTDFIKSACRMVSMYGFCYVGMDDYKESDKIGGREDYLVNRTFPFFTTIEPQSVDVEQTFFNDKDQLEQFAYSYQYRNEENEFVTRTKIITRAEIIIKEGDNEIETIPYDITLFHGNFPVKIVKMNEDIKNSKLLASTPPLYSIVKSVVNIGILDAALDYSLFRGSFSQFVYSAGKNMWNIIKDAMTKGLPFKLGQEGVIVEDSQQSNRSQFISPKVGDSEAISNRKKDKFEQMSRETGRKYSQGATASSAESKVMDEGEINSNLAIMAKIAEDLDIWIDLMFSYQLSFELVEALYDYRDGYGQNSVKEQSENLLLFYDALRAFDIEGTSEAQKQTLISMAKLNLEDKALITAVGAIESSTANESAVQTTTFDTE